jgi:UDP-N-acetylglucosamine--N-acetylmuramyl-(pentapeptide) pyrophosphoryl-undecaprenol N-acetylglucosamine transferase
VVLSTGGFVAVPVGIGAALTRRPLVMHEQITSVGLANHLLARVATAVALSHASSTGFLPSRARDRATVTGSPIRAAYGLDPDLPLIYVTGGAPGSAQINDLIAQVAASLLERCQILHQTGPDHHQRALAQRDTLRPHAAARYQPVPYVNDELPDVLAAADLVISRAGAGTLAELTALGKAAVLIRLEPTAADEQRRNAEHLASQGAAVAITRPDVSAEGSGARSGDVCGF